MLPRYRGAAPIHWAIANGETITGLTTMQIDAGMDTGPTLLRREVEIGPDETAPELAARMSAIGADLIAESLLRFDRGEISPAPQDEKDASYAPILKKEDGRIDWDATRAHKFTTACAASRPGPARTPRFEGKRAISGAARQRPAQSGPRIATGEIIHTTTIFMLSAAKELACGWKPCKSKGARKSPRANLQTARAWPLTKGLTKFD